MIARAHEFRGEGRIEIEREDALSAMVVELAGGANGPGVSPDPELDRRPRRGQGQGGGESRWPGTPALR